MEITAIFEAVPQESIFAPLFKLLEVVFELLVPLVVAHMIDSGIGERIKGSLFVRFC